MTQPSPDIARAVRPYIESALRWQRDFEGSRGQNGLTFEETADLITGRLLAAIPDVAQTEQDPFNRKQVEAICRAVCAVECVDPDDDVFGDGCDAQWTRYADAVAGALSPLAQAVPTPEAIELAAAAISREGFPRGRESARDYRLRLARAAISSKDGATP